LSCLNALESTGVDNDTKELNALWVESFHEIDDSDDDSEKESDKGCQPHANGVANRTNGKLIVSLSPNNVSVESRL
jgi:hypothetical protein